MRKHFFHKKKGNNIAVKWKWKPAAGGSVSPELQNKVNQNTTNITNLQNNTAKLNQANTFTGTNTFNNQVSINSAGNDFTWETTRTWNQNIDNTVARTKDLTFVRQVEYLSNITQPNNQWNKTSWNWNWSGINTEGLHEVLVIVSIENIPYSLNAKLVWKNGVTDSISPLLIVEHGDTTFHFQLVIKSNNKFHIYTKKTAGTKTIQWVRIWFVRGVNLPWKMNQLW